MICFYKIIRIWMKKTTHKIEVYVLDWNRDCSKFQHELLSVMPATTLKAIHISKQDILRNILWIVMIRWWNLDLHDMRMCNRDKKMLQLRLRKTWKDTKANYRPNAIRLNLVWRIFLIKQSRHLMQQSIPLIMLTPNKLFWGK